MAMTLRDDGLAGLYTYSNNNFSYAYVPADQRTGVWNHFAANVVITATGTMAHLYLNGNLLASGTTAASCSIDGGILFRQGINGISSAYSQGTSADAFLYEKTLSQAEIQSLMTTRPTNYSDSALVGYWPMNEGGRVNFSFDYSTSSLNGQYFQNMIHISGPTWARRSIP
jgi:hypothetical protein